MVNSLKIARSLLTKWGRNYRIYVILILLTMYLHMLITPINNFSGQTGVKMTPWLFPFLTSNWFTLMLLMLGVVFLLCDAPFIDQEQPYILIRSGRKRWLTGQLLYVLFATLIYTLVIFALSVILLIPSLRFEADWGKIIYTFAQTGTQYAHGISLVFSQQIVLYYAPVSALLLSLFLFELVSLFLGVLIYTLNTVFGNNIGTIASVGFILLEVFALNASGYSFTYYSPVSWASLSIVDIKGVSRYPSLAYVLIVLCVLITLLVGISFHVNRRKNIQVQKPI